MLEQVSARLRAIRWVDVCFDNQVSDDEACAMIVCSPCYLAAVLGVIVVASFAVIGWTLHGCCGSVARVCTGRARTLHDVQTLRELRADRKQRTRQEVEFESVGIPPRSPDCALVFEESD